MAEWDFESPSRWVTEEQPGLQHRPRPATQAHRRGRNADRGLSDSGPAAGRGRRARRIWAGPQRGLGRTHGRGRGIRKHDDPGPHRVR